MAVKTTESEPQVNANEPEPTVQIYLPLLEAEDAGAKVDQTEHVTINGYTTIIQRGQYVPVKVPVFLALKVKYPNL
jgi:hypothetical protein